MSSSKHNFYKLSPIHQKALHELWIRKNDSNYEVSQATTDFLFENQSVLRENFDLEFERQPFQLGSYTRLLDSDILLLNNNPSTPPPSDSDSEGESNSSISTDHINRHKIRSGETFLRSNSSHKHTNSNSVEIDNDNLSSPLDSFRTMSNDHENDQVHPDDHNNLEEGEEPSQNFQIGFNGKPLTSGVAESSIFMSTTKRSDSIKRLHLITL
jgi:hypothetical protein